MRKDKFGRTSLPRVRSTEIQDQQEANGEITQDVSDPEFAVGYKRPPVHSQFKKGVSGNPGGRRKGYSNPTEEIQRVFLCKLPVSDGSKVHYVSKIVLLHTLLLNQGLKGNKAAALSAAKMAERFGVYDVREEKPEPDLSMVTKEEREICSQALTIIRNAKARR